MQKYLICYGVSGDDYNDTTYALIWAKDLQDAGEEAYQRARDACESYGMEDEDPDHNYEDDEEVPEFIEDWVDCMAELWTNSKEQQKMVEGHYFYDETENE